MEWHCPLTSRIPYNVMPYLFGTDLMASPTCLVQAYVNLQRLPVNGTVCYFRVRAVNAEDAASRPATLTFRHDG